MADLVPGKMRCAKCSFSVVTTNLNMSSGMVSAGDNSPQRCPNGCGPLWPITWEQEARECYATAEALFERVERAEKALAELRSRLGPRRTLPERTLMNSITMYPEMKERMRSDPTVREMLVKDFNEEIAENIVQNLRERPLEYLPDYVNSYYVAVTFSLRPKQ